MLRSKLIQNYIKNNGTLFEDFETIGEWSIAGSGGRTAVANTSQFLTGTQSIRLSVQGSMTIDKIISAYLATAKLIRIGYYVNSDFSTFDRVQLFFSSTTDFSKYMKIEYNFTYATQGGVYGGGWHYGIAALSDFTSYGGESWNNQMIRLRIGLMSNAGQTAVISVDELRIGMEYLPFLMLTFDDNRSTVYEVAYPYMRDRGLPGTVYTVKNWVGLNNYMTLTNLQTLYTDGWAIGNHTTTHCDASSGLSGLTLDQQKTEISECTNYLIANNMPRAARHVAYPLDAWNINTLQAMDELGMDTGRMSSSGRQQFSPVGNRFKLNARTILSTDSLSMVKGYVDAAYNKGVSLQLIFHKFFDATDGTTTWWTPGNFCALIDHIIARRIPCVTIDQWYRGLTNLRYRSIPVSRIAV